MRDNIVGAATSILYLYSTFISQDSLIFFRTHVATSIQFPSVDLLYFSPQGTGLMIFIDNFFCLNTIYLRRRCQGLTQPSE